MQKAFLPGAGLGTRLRPLTSLLPKPLLPLYHRPLVRHALDHCRAAGFRDFAINTHHLADAWRAAFPPAGRTRLRGANGLPAWRSEHAGCPVTFFHEPVLLDTGGGVRNIVEWSGGDPVLVHNGDIFTNLPLAALVRAHEASGLPATLALRSHGAALHVAVDPSATRVTDIRRRLDRADGTHQFTGIYCASPGLVGLLPAAEPASVIPAFLELARAGRLGCVVIDDGVWMDLGDPSTYLTAHLHPPADPAVPRIHPAAAVDAGAVIDDLTWIGPGATVGPGTVLAECVVLPGAGVPSGTHRHSIIPPAGAILTA